MRAYMVGEYRRMKQEMKDNPSDISNDTALISMIGNFLTEKAPRNTIILDRTWTARGRPTKDYAKILNEKTDTGWAQSRCRYRAIPSN